MISFRGSSARVGEPTGLGFGVALLCGLASMGCSEGSTEPPVNTAGSIAMGGSGGSPGGNGGSGNAMGGSSGSGGASGGAGGGSSAATTVYAFNTSVEGFRINYVCTTAVATSCVAINPPAAATPVDAGADAGDAAAPPSAEPDNGLASVSHDPIVGSPQPGSIKVDINFSEAGQLAILALNIPTVDLTGKTITALVTVEAGAPPQVAGKMYVKTGELYVYADSGQLTLTPGVWSTLSYSMPGFVAAGMYDIADVREIGIEFATPLATAFSPAVIHVDTVQY